MRIAVIGVGYVGLVSGACLSDFGHAVMCLDKDEEKINKLKSGEVTIFEPGLEELVKKNFLSKRLSFSTDLVNGVKSAEVVFIAVGTPSRRETGAADLGNIFSVLDSICQTINENQLIVVKSTVPVGTNRKINGYLKEKTRKVFSVVSNPEFLREGSAIEDFMKPDRIVVGSDSENTHNLIKEIYKPLYLRDFPIVFTDPESAEIIKYASNAFLATKISFINEVAILCEKLGGDVKEVAKGMGFDGRIGEKFLRAGPGYGGSCFPKDTKAFANTGREFNAQQHIVETVIKVNEKIKNRMLEKIQIALENRIAGKTLCFLGVTFKPNTDDMRDAPSLSIIPHLTNQGGEIRIVDPKGSIEGKALFANASWYDDPYNAATDADIVVILTEWNEFRALNLEELSRVMKNPVLMDLRNLYSKEEALKSGFKTYESVGRR